MIHTDAVRFGASSLSQRVVNVEGAFLTEAFNFLDNVVRQIASTAGRAILARWMASVKDKGQDFVRDEFIGLKKLGVYVRSRTQPLSDFTPAEYATDWPP